MRKWNLGRVLFLALPVMLAGVGCGGVDDLFGDGGTSDLAGSCGSGVTLYALGSGTYTVQSVSNVNDGCNLQPSALMGISRDVVYDSAQGTLTLKGNAGRPDLGTGAVRCNVGLLTLPATADTNGSCSYTLSRESQVTVTAASTFTVKFKEVQTMKGAMCNPTADCTTTFDMVWKR